VLSGEHAVGVVNGAATFSDLSLDKPGTGYTLTAAADGLSGSTSSPFSVVIGVPVATVTVTPGHVELNDENPWGAGFTATASDAAGQVLTGRRFTWTSSDPNAVYMESEESSMWLCALANGSETLTATIGGKSGTAQLTVDVDAGSGWFEHCAACIGVGC
jgi:hypothetical protein